MQISNQVVLVTGGGKGIGEALAIKASQQSPRVVIVADRDQSFAESVSARCESAAEAICCDVCVSSELAKLTDHIIEKYGSIDIVFSNAGATAKGGLETSLDDWNKLWQINVLSHVELARLTIPHMAQKGSGAFVVTASAAGVLTEIGSLAYSVTKHGSIAIAEWLSVHYRRQGVQLHCLCPAGVATDFLDLDDPIHQFLHMSALTAEQVAEAAFEAIELNRFLVLPHKEVLEFFQFKTQDYDRWLHNFSRVQERLAKLASKNQS
ncbi:SDR family NAD(P)-dependent oxidoreductase [Planctopirus hydrillae]|uniref:Short-chain dehydrogenase n=1 Tax=Planctopirus hydrillae TaxID=1841610 RepID=A0A1C3E3Z4_9PLAN|nr:SDR family oxidoreductase [Planctopirus hydrillae]ODA27957.1 short-chain dehydrogenase [Planctopirus hydrillae]